MKIHEAINLQEEAKKLINLYLSNDGYSINGTRMVDDECRWLCIIETDKFKKILAYQRKLEEELLDDEKIADKLTKYMSWMQLEIYSVIPHSKIERYKDIYIILRCYYHDGEKPRNKKFLLNFFSELDRFNISIDLVNEVRDNALVDFVIYNTRDIDHE